MTDLDLVRRELRAAAAGQRGERVRGRTLAELRRAGVRDPRAALDVLRGAGCRIERTRLPRSGERSYRLTYEPAASAVGRAIDTSTPSTAPTTAVDGAPAGAPALFDLPASPRPHAAAPASPYDVATEAV